MYAGDKKDKHDKESELRVNLTSTVRKTRRGIDYHDQASVFPGLAAFKLNPVVGLSRIYQIDPQD